MRLRALCLLLFTLIAIASPLEEPSIILAATSNKLKKGNTPCKTTYKDLLI